MDEEIIERKIIDLLEDIFKVKQTFWSIQYCLKSITTRKA